MTSDFRSKPFETIEAHVSMLANFLKNARFTSFLYLSSTRVYEGASEGTESNDLIVNPQNANHIFNLSKLAGESLCLASGKSNVRIARLSNVIGDDYKSDNFLFSVLKDVIKTKKALINMSPQSSKDYVAIEDVIKVIRSIASTGKSKIYNVASGRNITNKQISDKITEVSGAEINYSPSASTLIFPTICIKKITEEFHFRPTPVVDMIPQIYAGLLASLKLGNTVQ